MEAGKRRLVTRPKEFREQLAFLVAEGTKDNIERARGDQSKADFLREAIDEHVKRGLRREAAAKRP